MTTFLRKHQRLISFIGASIVFATFIVREVVREHLKDLADSLDQAENLFAIRGQLYSTNQRLRQIAHQQDLTEMDKLPKRTPAFVRHKAGIDDLVERDISEVDDLESNQDNLKRLLRKFPSDTYLQTLKDHSEELAQLKTERDQMETAMTECDNANTPDKHCSWDFMYDMDRKSDELDDKLFWMGVELKDLSTPILADAERALARRESWYGYANIASVILFTLGWGLGLAGNLYQIKGLAAGEE